MKIVLLLLSFAVLSFLLVVSCFQYVNVLLFEWKTVLFSFGLLFSARSGRLRGAARAGGEKRVSVSAVVPGRVELPTSTLSV